VKPPWKSVLNSVSISIVGISLLTDQLSEELSQQASAGL